MNVLLIYPTISRIDIASRKSLSVSPYLPPLGILYLGSVLEQNGHNVEVIDSNAEKLNKQRLTKAIKKNDIVGMTIFSDPRELKNSISVAKIIKDINPKIYLIIGGPHCSSRPKKAIVEHNADICVRGAGENVIIPIIEAVEEKRKLSLIPNIYYKEGGEIRHTNSSDKIKDIDSFPFPARHLVEKYNYGYLEGTKIAKGKVTSITSSRGCPHKCKFCALHAHLPVYMHRSVSNITAEIEEIANQGYTTLVFVDDNFLTEKKKVMEIMDFIIDKEFNLKLWIFGARADSADKTLYMKMKEAGVEYISYGIESGNQDVLDYLNKKLTISQIKDAVKLSHEMGFFITGTFIIGSPIETKKHINNTIKFARSLPLVSVSFFPFAYPYGSPIWNDAVKEGKIQPDEDLVVADSNRGLGNFTREEVLNYTMQAHKRFFLNPRLWKRELTRAILQKDLRFIILGIRMFSPWI